MKRLPLSPVSYCAARACAGERWELAGPRWGGRDSRKWGRRQSAKGVLYEQS